MAIIALKFRDPMKEALLLAISCSSRVSKVSVGWPGQGDGCKSVLLRGCGCSGLPAGTRMVSGARGDLPAGDGVCGSARFTHGPWCLSIGAVPGGCTDGA